MAMPNWISVNPDGGSNRTSVSVIAIGNVSTSAAVVHLP